MSMVKSQGLKCEKITKNTILRKIIVFTLQLLLILNGQCLRSALLILIRRG